MPESLVFGGEGVILKVKERKISVIYTGVNSVAKLSYKLKGSARLLKDSNLAELFFFFLIRFAFS